ncbi:MAG: hypothetical protein K940chlam3_01649 [Chlamydiae bacterium]|nr:hypothetical protein [Chlamydiota bacterium]
MPSNTPVQELNDLGEQFLKWRQDNPRRHHPRHLWDSALLLAKKHSFKDVSKQIGFAAAYIRRKLNKRKTPILSEPKFVEIQPYQADPFKVTQDVKVRIQQPGGMITELSFQGDVEQIFPFMHTLFQGDSQ